MENTHGATLAPGISLFRKRSSVAAKVKLRGLQDPEASKIPRPPRRNGASSPSNYGRSLRKRAGFIDEAEADALADMAFSKVHWRKIDSPNRLERWNGAGEGRDEVVGLVPDDEAVVGLPVVAIRPTRPMPESEL